MREVPFDGKLEPVKVDGDIVVISKLKNEPNKLVRENVIGGKENIEDAIERHNLAKKLFLEMEKKYAIKIVSMDNVVGRNEKGALVMFTVVDKINGQNLDEIEKLPKSAQSDLEDLVVALCKQYKDAWENDGYFWGDYKLSQFVYGSKFGEEEKLFYLVDVDPHFYKHNNKSKKRKAFNIQSCVESILHDLVRLENKFSSNTKFMRARKELGELVAEIGLNISKKAA